MDGIVPSVYGATMPDVPDPARAESQSQSYTPRPLTESSFKGMLNTSDARVESNYRYSPINSEVGHTNRAAQGGLYNRRLDAQLALNQRSAAEGNGAKAWNERRAAAIARGEDADSALLEAMEKRPPDSFIERGWRKLRGKPPTKYEERMEKERKEKEKQAKVEEMLGNHGGDAAFEKGGWQEKVRESESDDEGETQGQKQKRKREMKRKEAEDGVIR